MVRLIEQPPEVQQELPPLPPPKHQPAKTAPSPQVTPPVPDVIPASATITAASLPPIPQVAESIPAATAPVVTAARFDADYLSNPKPVYPTASRRLGEEGKVMLRVHVSAEGSALEVEVKRSCGFTRLDEAAREAVARWRFVPARRGSEPVDSWVTVPVTFSLQIS